MLGISPGFLTMYAINREGLHRWARIPSPTGGRKSRKHCVWLALLGGRGNQLRPEGCERLHVAATTDDLYTNVELKVQWCVLRVSWRPLGDDCGSFLLGQLLVTDLTERLEEPEVCPNVEAAIIWNPLSLRIINLG